MPEDSFVKTQDTQGSSMLLLGGIQIRDGCACHVDDNPDRKAYALLGERLIELIDRRKWTQAAQLIESGADIHYGNGYALRTAIACNAPNFLTWLLCNGANPAVCDLESWQHAVIHGNVATLRILARANPPDRMRTESLLVLSAQEGRVKCTQVLLENGQYSPRGMEAAVLAADRRRHRAVLEVLFEDMIQRKGWQYVKEFISFNKWPEARSVVGGLHLERRMLQIGPIRHISSGNTKKQPRR